MWKLDLTARILERTNFPEILKGNIHKGSAGGECGEEVQVSLGAALRHCCLVNISLLKFTFLTAKGRFILNKQFTSYAARLILGCSYRL